MKRLRSLTRAVLVVALSSLPSAAYGARAPTIVNREFVFKGEAALQAIETLGLSPGQSVTLTLVWDRSLALRECSSGNSEVRPPFRRCEEIQAPVNHLTFHPSPEPQLVVGGSWLDGETGSGPRVPRYSFNSPSIKEAEEVAIGDWRKLIHEGAKKQHSSSTNNKAIRQGERDLLPFLTLTTHTVSQGTVLIIGIDEQPRATRDAKSRRYAECMKKSVGLDGPGC